MQEIVCLMFALNRNIGCRYFIVSAVIYLGGNHRC